MEELLLLLLLETMVQILFLAQSHLLAAAVVKGLVVQLAVEMVALVAVVKAKGLAEVLVK
jgi:hypothetical protein